MKSTARIAGHPLHPMLIVLPAGGFVMTLILDVLFLVTGAPIWWVASIPVLLISIVGGLVAAVPGAIDLFTVARKQGAFRIGVIHGLINVAVVGLFAVNLVLRWPTEPTVTAIGAPLWLTLIGVAMLAVSGWLGWTMVQTYHVGPWEHPEAKDPDPHLRDHAHDADVLPPGEPLTP